MSAALPQIEQELGPRFVSAAIDPFVGNRLVVHVAGSAADLHSPTLASLDTPRSEVRLVEEATNAPSMTAAYEAAAGFAGKTIGGSHIRSVAEDDMAAKVLIGVDHATPEVEQWFARRGDHFVIQEVPLAHPLDATTSGSPPFVYGNKAARSATPVAGAESIVQSGAGPCTSAWPAKRNGASVLITAGHCKDNENQFLLGAPPYAQTVIGDSVEAHYGDSTHIDVTAIAAPVNARQCIVRNIAGSLSCAPISFRTQRLVQGMPVTKDGSSSGETTGQILVVNATPTVLNVGSFDSMIETNTCVKAGDSGGALFIDNADGTVTPLGITSLAAGDADTHTPCDETQVAYFQNWKNACQILGIDTGCQGTTTIGVARADTSTDQIKWLRSNDNINPVVLPTTYYGRPSFGDVPVVGDWDGNGTATAGVVRFDPTSYMWQWKLSADNSNSIPGPQPLYGSPFCGDVPVVGDWDGDGVDTIGFARANTPTHQFEWHLSNDNASTTTGVCNDTGTFPLFGQANVDPGIPDDIPVVGDWDGDGIDTIGFARPRQDLNKLEWFLSNNNVNAFCNHTGEPTCPRYGQPTDLPVVGDWNGDLSSSIGVARPLAIGQFQWILSNDDVHNICAGNPCPVFGQSDATPVVGDWNGKV